MTALLKQELFFFIVIGVIATAIDFSVYSLGHLLLPYSIAKGCSFTVGSIFSYLGHKRFTFRQKHHKADNMLRFAILYILCLLVNVSVNSGSISLLTTWIIIQRLNHPQLLIFSFLVATAASTALSFLGQKFWVFRNIAITPEDAHYVTLGK